MKKQILAKLRKMQNTIRNDFPPSIPKDLFPPYCGRATFANKFVAVIDQIELYKLSDRDMGLLLKQKEAEFKEAYEFVQTLEPPKKAR